MLGIPVFPAMDAPAPTKKIMERLSCIMDECNRSMLFVEIKASCVEILADRKSLLIFDLVDGTCVENY